MQKVGILTITVTILLDVASNSLLLVKLLIPLFRAVIRLRSLKSIEYLLVCVSDLGYFLDANRSI